MVLEGKIFGRASWRESVMRFIHSDIAIGASLDPADDKMTIWDILQNVLTLTWHIELGGAMDLINKYRLWPLHEYFCKRSLPLSIAETRYLHNVVGDTEIRKGEGMELDQLVQHSSYLRERNASMLPFELDALREAFHIRETKPVNLPSAEKGLPTSLSKSKNQFKYKEKSKKHSNKDKKDHCNVKQKFNDIGNAGDMDRTKNGLHNFDLWKPNNQHYKKRKHGASKDPSICRHRIAR